MELSNQNFDQQLNRRHSENVNFYFWDGPWQLLSILNIFYIYYLKSHPCLSLPYSSYLSAYFEWIFDSVVNSDLNCHTHKSHCVKRPLPILYVSGYVSVCEWIWGRKYWNVFSFSHSNHFDHHTKSIDRWLNDKKFKIRLSEHSTHARVFHFQSRTLRYWTN